VTSATQILSISVAAKPLLTGSSAGRSLLLRRVLPLLLPRVQPRSPAWRMSLSTRLREQRVPSVLDPTWTLGDPYVRPLRSWISRIVSVRTPSSRFLAEDGLPDYIVS
jgi:hypothetical protein